MSKWLFQRSQAGQGYRRIPLSNMHTCCTKGRRLMIYLRKGRTRCTRIVYHGALWNRQGMDSGPSWEKIRADSHWGPEKVDSSLHAFVRAD